MMRRLVAGCGLMALLLLVLAPVTGQETPKEAPKAPAAAPKAEAPKAAPAPEKKDAAPAAAPAPAGDKVALKWNNKVTQEQKQTFVFSWTTVKQEGDIVTLKQKIESVEMAIDIGGTKIEYNSTGAQTSGNPLAEFFKALVGAEFTVLLDTKENKISKILDKDQFVAKLVNANPAMQPLLNNILDEKAFIDMSEPTFRVVPTKPVAKGETWDLKSSLKLGPIGSYASDYKYTYEGKEGALDKIGISATLKYEPGTSASGSLPFKIENAKLESTKASGTVLFDNTKGRAEKSSMTMEVKGNLTIDIGGQKTTVDINQTQSTTFETSDANPSKK